MTTPLKLGILCATLVLILAGLPMQADKLDPMYTSVAGTIVDSNGNTVSRARVEMHPAGGAHHTRNRSRRGGSRGTPTGTWLQIVLAKPNGDFLYNRVTPRKYVLVVSKPGVGTARVTIDPQHATPLSNLVITLHPSHRHY